MPMTAVSDALADAVSSLIDDTLPIPVPSLLGPVYRACGCSE